MTQAAVKEAAPAPAAPVAAPIVEIPEQKVVRKAPKISLIAKLKANAAAKLAASSA